MTLRPHAAFAAACGGKECATRRVYISGLKICLPRDTRCSSLRGRSGGKQISSMIRGNQDKAGSASPMRTISIP